MRRLVLLLAVALVACQGPPGPVGPAGPAGPPGPGAVVDSDGGADAFMCTPGKQFCRGDEIWACTLSGSDAVFAQDCMINPGDPRYCKEHCGTDVTNGPCCVQVPRDMSGED